MNFKHGMSGTPEWHIYREAKKRCQLPTNKDWKNYGGRGIKFCFVNFQQFISEIGRRPHPDLELDRINNDGNYEPGNCRWATREEQELNKRIKRTRGFCFRGHPLVGRNVYLGTHGTQCRTCRDMSIARRRRERQAASQ